MEKLRKLVSGDKYRFVDPALGVNLDLTYITPRIIAMGLPGQSVDALWRNDIDDVSKFLHSRHGTKFMIINLSGEKYDYKKFHGREIRDFYFPDHSPPDIPLLLEIMTAMQNFLIEDPDNVVAIHCLAGRSRTGCVVACFLLHSGSSSSADEAIRFFNESRSSQGRNIVLPSQVRYVRYYETILRTGKDASTAKSIQLVRVELSPLPPVQKCKHVGSITPVVEVYSHRTPRSMIYRSSFTRKFRYRDDPNAVAVEIDGCVTEGDVQIKLFHQARSTTKFARIIASDAIGTKVALTCAPKFPLVPLCRATFNTTFVDPATLRLTFTKEELDAVYAGPLTSVAFPPNFTLTLVFDTPSARNPMSVLRPLSTPPSASLQLPSAPVSAPLPGLPSAPSSMPIPVYTTPVLPPAPLQLSAQHLQNSPHLTDISPRHNSSPAIPTSISSPTPSWVAARTSDASLVHPSQLASPPSHYPVPQQQRLSDPGGPYASPHSSMGRVMMSQYLSPHASMSQWSTAPPQQPALPPVVLPPPSATPVPPNDYAATTSNTSAWGTHQPQQAGSVVDPLQMSVLPSNSTPPYAPGN